MSIRVSELVMTPPERIFSFLSDFEKAPQYSSFWTSVKLIERKGIWSTYQTVAETQGQRLVSATMITSEPYEKIEVETIAGDGEGTNLNFKFQIVPGGTELILEGNIVLSGFARIIERVLKPQIESTMQEELKRIKDAVEKA